MPLLGRKLVDESLDDNIWVQAFGEEVLENLNTVRKFFRQRQAILADPSKALVRKTTKNWLSPMAFSLKAIVPISIAGACLGFCLSFAAPTLDKATDRAIKLQGDLITRLKERTDVVDANPNAKGFLITGPYHDPGLFTTASAQTAADLDWLSHATVTPTTVNSPSASGTEGQRIDVWSGADIKKQFDDQESYEKAMEQLTGLEKVQEAIRLVFVPLLVLIQAFLFGELAARKVGASFVPSKSTLRKAHMYAVASCFFWANVLVSLSYSTLSALLGKEYDLTPEGFRADWFIQTVYENSQVALVVTILIAIYPSIKAMVIAARTIGAAVNPLLASVDQPPRRFGLDVWLSLAFASGVMLLVIGPFVVSFNHLQSVISSHQK